MADLPHSINESEHRYRVLFNDNPLPMWVCDRQTLAFLDVNTAAIKTYGYSREEFLTMNVKDIRPPESIPDLLEDLKHLDENRKTVMVHQRKDGSTLHVEITRHPVQYGDRQAVLVLANDLTEKIRAQQSVAVANEVLNTVAAFVLMADSTANITYVSPSISALGYEPSEVLGDGWWNLTRPDPAERDRTKQLMSEIAQGKVPVSRTPYETTVQCKDGSWKWILWQDSAQIPGFVIGVGQDITERKATQEALERSEARLRKLVESNVVGVNFSHLNGHLIDANDAFLNMIGFTREEMESGVLRWDLITAPEYADVDRRAIEDLKESGVCRPIEKEYIHKDGSRVPVLLGVAMLPGSATECVCIVVDLSEQKRLEQERQALHQELIQSHKMEAVGQLAGGIAHDFNNILNVIGGYTELIASKLPPGDPLCRNADRVLTATKRAADLVAQLLAFSRKQMLTTRVLNLNFVIDDILEMLRRLIREDIQLIFSPAPDLGLVSADRSQIEQVIINLTVNARDAMRQGGELRISTRNVCVEPSSSSVPGLQPGEYVNVTVSDTGCGMDKETMSRIFEPFFTTKEFGLGTGLGLSTVYGIVKQSGGEIQVESEPGRGATFAIYLPKSNVDLPAPVVSQEPQVGTLHGRETILVVEDEEALRDAACEYLERLGYKVLAARDGEEALRVATRYPGELELLITDLVMPRLNGRAVRERLLRLRPGVKVIFMSGYAEDSAEEAIASQDVPLLRKPFMLRDLGRLVRRVVDSEVADKSVPGR
ncbi:MAG TPA: PAS domain S-box protein [Candidatus Angelobacter sp.]|jgi:PAS domain S-box-containing protein|nr:PAS domain S-box protein [Candidatus Angelobacter sp.]